MADLNAIAHGIDSDSGEYLTSEQRKAMFKKGKMKSPININAIRSGVITVPKSGNPKPGALARSSALVKQPKVEEKSEKAEQAEFETDEVQTVFNQTKITFVNILKVKREKENLRDKYFKLLGKKKPTPVQEEGEGDTTKKGRKMPFKAPNFNIMGFLGDIIQFAIFDWISKPENKKIVEIFTNVFKVVAKFFNWFVTGVIDNLLTGFAELVGGDSILERIGGFFKLLFGVVGLRWLLNPFKILKDLKNIFKFGKKFTKIFKGIFKLGDTGLKKTFSGVLKLAGKAFRKTLGRMIQRVLLKVFGKAITKGMIAVTKSVVKGVTKIVGKVPIVGPLIAFGVNLMMGEPLGRAAFKTLGSIFLSGVGTALGGPVGWAIGGLIGDWAGGTLYDAFFGGKEKEKKEDTPELASGGVVSGPEEGYLAILHGTEAVIPISKIPEILTLPFKVLGSKIIGSIFAVINAMGSVGGFIRPIAVSILAPAMKAFGSEKVVANREVGQTQGSSETIKNKINIEKDKQDLDKLFGKNIFKEIGKMLLIGGGSIFGPLFGGSAQAKSSDPSSKRPGTGAGSNSSESSYSGSSSGGGGVYAPILDLIAKYESGSGGYESMYPGTTLPGATKMTIAEVARKATGAVGMYQNMPRFLHARAKAVGLDPNTALYNEENQRKIAVYLIEDGQAGVTPQMLKENPDEAMIRLSRVWAAIPVPKNMQGHTKQVSKGESYYAGVGSNKAHITPEMMYKAMGTSAQLHSTIVSGKTPPGVPGSDTSTPGQNLTPEQKSSMFQKSGMSAMAANALSSVSTGVEREPDTSGAKMLTGTNKGPVPPVTSQATISKNTQTSAMVPMSNNFSLDRKVKQTRSASANTFIMNTQTSNNMNVLASSLNSTSIGESILLNRI